MRTRHLVALALALVCRPALAADVGISAQKLVVVDNLASYSGRAKAVFVSRDPNVVKGPAGDPAALAAGFEIFYTDAPGNMGAYEMPDPWLENAANVAKYANQTAPTGGGVRKATLKSGLLAKVTARSLGDSRTIDLIGGGAPGAGGMTVVLTLATADGKVTRLCSRFSVADGSIMKFSETGGGTGRRLSARNGVAAPCPALGQETVSIPSGAEPAETPGSPGADANDYPDLVTQFGNDAFSLNNATYTRYFYEPLDGVQPEAILVLVPGFEGGAASFRIMAENLLTRARSAGRTIEVWAFDRRGHQIEDREGIHIAEAALDPQIALDWLYGGELGLMLHPALVAGPNRRAIFHDTNADTAFMANWTGLLFSRDIDVVIEAALAVAANQNVFLGGHSAGTGFTARYAATNLNLTGVGPADPGYAKVRGLVLLEGGGGSVGGTPLTADSLDRIEDQADGGLFHAVRDNNPRCVDGTPCTVATEAVDCAGKGKEKCTPQTTAYAIVAGLLNPRILAAVEPGAIQGITDPDTGQVIIQVDQGAPGNNAVAQVPDLNILGGVIAPATATGALGTFLDDDGLVSSFATFVRTSLGAPGPVVGGLLTWLAITDGPMPPSVLPYNNCPPMTLPPCPPPTAFPPAVVWGQEKEVTDIVRMGPGFFTGDTNFSDWYYPSAGLSTTSASGVCTMGTCTKGNVGASCSNNGQCGQGINLDSTALSVTRGRRDIENLTEAGNVDVPVICFGGTNGLTPVSASFLAFAQSLGTCAATSCDGTPRVVNATMPSAAFPTFGDVDGGFEVHLSEGYAHLDIVTAEDDADNEVIAPLLAFIERNLQ